MLKRIMSNIKAKRIIRPLLLIQALLLVSGALLVAKPVYHFLKREILRVQAVKRWEEALKSSEKGNEKAWLSVPSADIETMVLHSDKKEDLLDFPVFANLAGNIKIIMAHRDIHFSKLKNAEKGGLITLQLRDNKSYIYSMADSEIIDPDQVKERLKSKSEEEWLVLMTCYPFQYIGPAPKRYLLWCRRIADSPTCRTAVSEI